MPTTLDGAAVFKAARILFAPGKAANAGGVAMSGLEMSQNSARMSWEEAELQAKLRELMKGIPDRCLRYGVEGGDPSGKGHCDYVKGANIAGFKKVADAMLAYGVV
jgi:glutamate dehydrogenase (NADP+)